MASVQDFQHVFLLYFSSILLLVGITTSSWQVNWIVTTVEIRSGLFKHCVEDHCVDQDGDITVKGMELIGLLAAVFCSICMTVHQAINSKSNNVINAFPQLAFFTSLAGGGLVFLGCAIYAFHKFSNNVYPSYSFVMALIGGIVLIVGGVASSKK